MKLPHGFCARCLGSPLPSISNRMINARGETIGTRPGFRDAYREKRCLLPADGFYEWAKLVGGGKQPVRVVMKSGEPFALAGRWSRWRPPEGDPMETCTIVTIEGQRVAAACSRSHAVILARAHLVR
jgi:putative SOS response-associated peptidase YedK